MTEKRNSREKFIELAEARVTKALKSIKLIGNLSNRTNYTYNNQDVRKIIKALESEIKVMKTRFDSKGRTSSSEFKL